jgi:hypothetical protein
MVQVNFSSSWENVCAFWQYFQLLLNKTLLSRTLPNKSQYSLPNLAEGFLDLAQLEST